MNRKLYLSAIAACFLAVISQAEAAEPDGLHQLSVPALQQQFQLYLPTNRVSVTTPATSLDSLHYVKQHTDKNKISHVRMQQEYAGFPVFGGYVILHSPKPATALLSVKNKVTMNGLIYHGLAADLGQPAAMFAEHAAIALQQFKEQYPNGSLSDEHVVPMVYIDDHHQAHWAYQVSVLVSHADQIPERPTAIVDAATFKPFIQWNALKTIRESVNGMGFGGNHLSGLYQFGRDRPLLKLTRTHSSAMCYMENNDVKVIDMQHKFHGANRAMRFGCHQDNTLPSATYWLGEQNDGYDQINGAYSPSNDALYAGQMIKDMYKDWYDIDVLTTADDKSMQLVMRVHYGDGYENAYWDGEQMTFGDGDTLMYPLVSVGIGAHEISHGFTEQHSNLQYFGQSGGMNEAFSDMAAQAAEYYSLGTNSWTIGAEIMKEESGYIALRFMDEPSRDGKSIERANQYRPGMDVHYSSGLYNRLFYLLSSQSDWSVQQAFHVMVKANMDYWTPYATFNEGACGVMSAAHDLGLPVSDVKQVLDQVAINYERCEV